MISVICSTNRRGSNSRKISNLYKEMLENQGAEVQLIDLADLPANVAFEELYGNRSTDYEQNFVSKVEKTEKFVFVIPEYNGGFPGILKLFIDSVPPKFFHNKKAGLVGIADGAAGAARAMDQFTNVLNYLRVDVIAQKPKLSGISRAFDEAGKMVNEGYLERLEAHVQRMIEL